MLASRFVGVGLPCRAVGIFSADLKIVAYSFCKVTLVSSAKQAVC
jgi:hypothetical protein